MVHVVNETKSEIEISREDQDVIGFYTGTSGGLLHNYV
jgi:hypothetical protein